MKFKIKVLILLYYWPPAGGPGVQRWLQMIKHLASSDTIEPIVFCPLNPDYPILDTSLEKQIPENLKIIKFPIKEPYRWIKWLMPTRKQQAGFIPEKEKQSLLQKGIIWIRGNWYIPDARVAWVKPSSEFLATYLKENPVDWIITTGPPHSLHLIGKIIKSKSNVKWLADFRDPWTNISYHKNLRMGNTASHKHQEMEKSVLTQADAVVTTSAWDASQFTQIVGREYVVIPNAYDIEPKDFIPFSKANCTICYAGNLESTRNPFYFWKAWQKHLEKPIQLDLYGIINSETLEEIDQQGLKHKVYQHGYVSHEELEEAYNNADVLMICTFNDEMSNGILPGKLFEYIALKKPIVAFGHPESHLKDWIESNGLGWYIASESEALDWLTHLFENLRQWKPPNELFIKKQGRKERVADLEKILTLSNK